VWYVGLRRALLQDGGGRVQGGAVVCQSDVPVYVNETSSSAVVDGGRSPTEPPRAATGAGAASAASGSGGGLATTIITEVYNTHTRLYHYVPYVPIHFGRPPRYSRRNGYMFCPVSFCITSRREWALLLFQDVCLYVCTLWGIKNTPKFFCA